MTVPYLLKAVPAGAERDSFFEALCGTTEEVAEKVGFSPAAPKGPPDNAALTVCLKAYPDTNLESFRNP
jgi:hypothetical protein